MGLVHLLGFRANTAVLAGLWATTAVLVLWAVFAGRRGRMRGAELALYVTLSGAFGCALAVLEKLLH